MIIVNNGMRVGDFVIHNDSQGITRFGLVVNGKLGWFNWPERKGKTGSEFEVQRVAIIGVRERKTSKNETAPIKGIIYGGEAWLVGDEESGVIVNTVDGSMRKLSLNGKQVRTFDLIVVPRG